MICICKTCNTEFKTIGKLIRTYCSNKCKFLDKDYNTTRISKEKNDGNYKLVSKLDKWETNDVLNKSGAITRYIESKGIVFNKETYLTYFDKEKLEKKEELKCPECDWYTNDIINKSGCFSTHQLKKHGYTVESFLTKHPSFSYLWKNFKPALKEGTGSIKCQICGELFEKLTCTHLAQHGITPSEYKEKYNIFSTCCEDLTNQQRIYSFERQIQGVFERIKTYKNIIPLFSKEEYSGVIGKTYNFKCLICNSEFEDSLDEGNEPVCKICNPSLGLFPNKKMENEFYDFLKTIDFNILTNSRKIIPPKEIDFVLMSKKIGIELNGLFWHSDRYRNEQYHINKTLDAKNAGYKLVHIFEDEWMYKKEIVKSKIKRILKTSDLIKLHARECTIKKISHLESNLFLEENHIQGKDTSKIKYGAFSKTGELVSVMTFSNFRVALGNKNINNDEYELVRFASKIDLNVRGIFSKLLKTFIRETNPKKIITYADIRYTSFENNVYNKNGFNLIKTTRPNYFWCKSGKRHYRFNFTKKILKKEGYDVENKTEADIMFERGYYRIYDCGHLKYEMVL